jgi:hypothetical protein
MNSTHTTDLPTFAVGSADFMARKAAKDAVPPPINKYGTLSGMSFDSAGNLITFLGLSENKNVSS